jgi:hypothetical protein
MRKLIVGLMAVGLLVGAGTASAQAPGSADPLGLITSGGIVPFFASTGNLSFLEVSSPVGENSGFLSNPFHLVFFNAACTRVESVDLPLTTNDIELLDTGIITVQGSPIDGLIAFGGTVDGVNLVPLSNPVHVRVFWADLNNDFVRVLEPISAFNAEASPIQTWNPLRSAATFFAPVEGPDFHTTLILICPNIGGVFPTAAGFPAFPITASASNQLLGLVFDDEEDFLRDVLTPCVCLTERDLTAISGVYSDTGAAPLGTYTELSGGAVTGGFASFTGYRAISAGGLDVFGRLSNGSRPGIIDGIVTPIR